MKKCKLKKAAPICINFSCLALLFCLLLPLNVCSKPKTPAFALVLSGGGARGLAQIGVLQALEDAGLKPDLVVGTSMGAIIAGLYSAGFSPQYIESFAIKVDWDNIFSNTVNRKKRFVSQKTEPANFLFELRFDYDFKPILPSSISYGQSFYDLLVPKLAYTQFLAKNNFDSLQIPLRIVATDILTGNRVIFSRGNLVSAIRASCSVPLAFSPVAIDSLLLIDGGLTTNIPVECARDEGAQVVLAVDVTSPLWKKHDLENPVKLVDQIISIGIARQKAIEKNKADVTITPELDKYSNTDFRFIDSLIRQGYNATQEKINEIKDCLTPQTPKITISPPDSVVSYGSINHLNISGNIKTSPRIIKTAAGCQAGDSISEDILQKSITSLYSTDLFENVNLEIDTSRSLHIMVQEKKYWRMRMGLRYDEFHLGEGYLQPAYENLMGLGVITSMHLQYGLRREKYALEFQGNHLFTSNMANNLQIQFYISKERIFQRQITESVSDTQPDFIFLHERALRKSGILGLIGTQIGKWALLSVGLRVERFKIQQSQASAFGDVLGLKFNESLPYLMLKLTVDTMDKFPFPKSGVKHYLTLGGTAKALGAKSNLAKLNGSFGRYFTFGKIHTIFPQIRFCWANDPLPEVEKVYVGGTIPEERYRDMNVYNYIPFMGLQPRALPGDILGLFHLNYRLMLKKNLHAQISADWGYTWEHGEFQKKTAVNDFLRYAPMGVGIGLVYETFLGPVRLSYGQLINDFNQLGIKSQGQLYFSAGHDF